MICYRRIKFWLHKLLVSHQRWSRSLQVMGRESGYNPLSKIQNIVFWSEIGRAVICENGWIAPFYYIVQFTNDINLVNALAGHTWVTEREWDWNLIQVDKKYSAFHKFGSRALFRKQVKKHLFFGSQTLTEVSRLKYIQEDLFFFA